MRPKKKKERKKEDKIKIRRFEAYKLKVEFQSKKLLWVINLSFINYLILQWCFITNWSVLTRSRGIQSKEK